MANKHFIISPQTYVSRNLELLYSIIDDEIVILSITDEAYYYLNSVGSEIWAMLNKPKKIDDLVNHLINNYDVSSETCMEETLNYLKELNKLKIVNFFNE